MPDDNTQGSGASAATEAEGSDVSTGLLGAITAAATASQAAGPDGMQGGGTTPEGIPGDAEDEGSHADAGEEEQGREEGSVSEGDKTGEEEEQPAEGEDQPSGDEEGEQEEEEAKPDNKKESTKVDDSKLPFSKHPRWKAVLRERDDARLLSEQQKPLVEAQQSLYQWCQQYGVSPQQFNEMLDIRALMNTNPMEAARKLKPLWDSLEPYVSDKVVDADLQDALQKAEITLPRAQEMQRLRNGEKGRTVSQQLSTQQAGRDVQLGITNAVATWDRNQQQKVPDFKPKAGPNARDGLYELTVLKFNSLRMAAPPRNEAEAIALAERAFNEARSFFTVPKATVTTKRLKSSAGLPGGETTATTAPKTLAQVVKGVANGTIKKQHIARW